MVNLHFPSQLTEEEETLKKKYEKLRRKKKALQNLNAPKPDPVQPKAIAKPGPLEPKKDAKEVAKILLKTGAISAIKVENKERQGFKRPKALLRRTACERTTGSVAGYQPFTATSQTNEDDSQPSTSADSSTGSPTGRRNTYESPRPQVKKLYESFVSSRKLDGDSKDSDRPIDHIRRDDRPERPRVGNTVYVRGMGVRQNLLQRTFETVGKIVNISMEMEKNCGFVTFEKVEDADRAIREFNGSNPDGVRLSVSLARRQHLMPPMAEDSSSLAWGSLAVNSSQKTAHEDTRDLVVYDDVV
ncbi:hypothetical protein JTE90_016737 [Oedothorax gibbosus]|uniref:Negative elongation factor E n=1 Tax=Oedothorax gibbosus TaxID=931172 RepID=A0AAV6U0D6_9ARAC|nr:hypothetical protein JTE90_016737 [Oedothorax gibbosus]